MEELESPPGPQADCGRRESYNRNVLRGGGHHGLPGLKHDASVPAFVVHGAPAPSGSVESFFGGDYVGRAGSKQVETLFKSRILYGGYELRDLSPDTVFQVVKSILEYRHFLDARFIQPTATAEDIRGAAKTIASEETLAVNHPAPVGGTAQTKPGLALFRKFRNRAEKIHGRLMWGAS